METLRTQSLGSVNQQVQRPERLSKAGQWMREHPDGIFEVHDWKAVNK